LLQFLEGPMIVALIGIDGALKAIKDGVGLGVGFAGTSPSGLIIVVFAPGESESGGVVDPETRFHASQAAEMPFVVDESIDEGAFIGVGGEKLLVEFGGEAGEIAGVFVIHDFDLGVDAMLEGVITGRGLTFRGTGAGAFLGVEPVGFLLLQSRH
jgi:hypothetical protein